MDMNIRVRKEGGKYHATLKNDQGEVIREHVCENKLDIPRICWNLLLTKFKPPKGGEYPEFLQHRKKLLPTTKGRIDWDTVKK